MKDTIYTIPVSEVFEPRSGCPLCRMRDTLEERCIEYIMGAAMMEPDVRQETNRQGFCAGHFAKMLPRKNRLSVGLMLQSHLDYIKKELVQAKAPLVGKDKRPGAAAQTAGGCYVCGRIDWAMERMLDTTLGLWAKEAAFRALLEEQEFLCFPHYALLREAAQGKVGKKQLPQLEDTLNRLLLQKLDGLKADIDGFCNLFDYRSAGSGPVPESAKTSLERAVQFLTGRC